MNMILLIVALLFAIASLSVKKSVPSIISFALMMVTLGVYYLSLHQQLLGLFQIFVYTGGIAVLMLFGMTLVGVEFPKESSRPWSAALAVLFFILILTFFFLHVKELHSVSSKILDNQDFANYYSDMVIVFALIGISLLYGTIKMMHVLKRRKDV